jgi:hypothetical protein
MRAFVGVCLLLVVIICGDAQAQTPVPGAKKQVLDESEEGMRAQWLRTCANDWDAATHMTKKEWDRVCRRVTEQRVRFRIDQQRKDELLQKQVKDELAKKRR